MQGEREQVRMCTIKRRTGRDPIGRIGAGVDQYNADPDSKACGMGSAFPSLITGERWYVVQTLPCREEKARIQLAAQGFRTFLPRYIKTVRHARKLSTVS